MKQKSIKNIRQEFKDNGIFYTPPELAVKLKSYVDFNPKSVYDPPCGAGNLLRVVPDSIHKYGQELDAEQLGIINLQNFTGYAGDTLADDGFAGMKFDCIVANPPFSVKWDPGRAKDDVRFQNVPVLPPPSKADWAFMIHIISHLSDDGIAVVLEFPGILYRGQKEGKVRKWFIDNNYIDKVANIPGNTFEDTSISTCIIVLKKNKKTTDIIFEDGERKITVPLEEIIANEYVLSVNTYIQEEVKKEYVDIDSVNKKVVLDLLNQINNTITMILSMQEISDDNFYLKELLDGLEEILCEHKGDGSRGNTWHI